MQIYTNSIHTKKRRETYTNKMFLPKKKREKGKGEKVKIIIFWAPL